MVAGFDVLVIFSHSARKQSNCGCDRSGREEGSVDVRIFVFSFLEPVTIKDWG